MTRPRILQIITRLGAGGSARSVIEVSRRLADEFDLSIAAGPEEAGEGSLRKLAVEAGIPVTMIASLGRRASILADRRALRELTEAIRAAAPALVHTHQPKAGVLGRMAAKRAGVRRLVHTFHGPLERLGRDGLLRRANLAAERRLARVTDRLVAVSPSLREELARQGVAAHERIEVILPLLEPRRLFEPRPAGSLRRRLGVPPEAPLYGLVGRLAPPKDPDLFLRVAATVASSIPQARAVVAGDGPERRRLEAEARRCGLGSSIHFLGWVEDVAAVYADLDVLVVTSAYEGFALSALEAMAAGKAVVATEVTGVVDVAVHGRSALLAPPGDAGGLAGAAILLLRDEGYRRRLGASAREEAQRRFGGEEDAAARTGALYARVIGLPVHRPVARAAPRAAAT